MTEHAPNTSAELAARRKRAVRTAVVVGAIALIVYVGFIMMGVSGS